MANSAIVIFNYCEINSMRINPMAPNQEHLISRVSFHFLMNYQNHDALVEVRQPFGTNYLAEPLEVRLPEDAPYRGPFPLQSFSNALDQYYRACIEVALAALGLPTNRAVNVSITLQNGRIDRRDGPYAFELPEVGGGWTLTGDFVRMAKADGVPKRSVPAMIDHRGETFRSALVSLDGNAYRDCKFIDCTMIFRAEESTSLIDVDFLGNNAWHFGGNASLMIGFLQGMYQSGKFGSELVESIVDDMVRKPA